MKVLVGGLTLCVVVGLLYVGSHSAHSQDNNLKSHRKLKPGPQIKHEVKGEHNEQYDHASFDPDAAHHNHELEDAYDDGHDPYDSQGNWQDEDMNGGFNITQRLHELFPLIDADKNGYVSRSEMEVWHYNVGMNQSRVRAEREFKASDEDSDGKISLKEYLGEDFDLLLQMDKPVEVGAEEPYNLEWVRSTRNTFKLADEDNDEYLTQAEFFNFLHPEETGTEKVLDHLLVEAIRDRDNDKDGKLTFDEFKENLWHEVKPWDEEDDDEDRWRDHVDHDYHEPPEETPEQQTKDSESAKKKFDELDVNKDGHLEPSELRSELKTLHPGEKDFAERQADHMIEQADNDKDGKLTLEEMVENPYVFYSAVGDDEDSYYHDEFRR